MQNPSTPQVTYARNAACYLTNTANYGLLLKAAADLNVEVYCNAFFASGEDKRRSRSGWIVKINGTPVY